MKKLIAILLACALLLAGTAFAAEWTEGRSPSKPYLGKPEADFSKTIGYMMFFPISKFQPQYYCDSLQIYMPREDLQVGIGLLRVYDVENPDEPAMIVDFDDGESVRLRPMTEAELDAYLWGGGKCYDIRLPYSLELGHQYYVLMDAGCLATEDALMSNSEIADPEKWVVSLSGDYGVSNLCYIAQPEAPEETADDAEEGEAAEETEDEAAEEADDEPQEPVLHAVPQAGDIITFDLTLGGEGKRAVIQSANDSVTFDEPLFLESGTYTGKVLSEELIWNIIFLDENNEYVNHIDVSR